jgi:hypothetical protein
MLTQIAMAVVHDGSVEKQKPHASMGTGCREHICKGVHSALDCAVMYAVICRGYNIGIRLIDEFLANSRTTTCGDFKETAEKIAKVPAATCILSIGNKLASVLKEAGFSCAIAGWFQNVFEHHGLSHQMELRQHRMQPGTTSWHGACGIVGRHFHHCKGNEGCHLNMWPMLCILPRRF